MVNIALSKCKCCQDKVKFLCVAFKALHELASVSSPVSSLAFFDMSTILRYMTCSLLSLGCLHAMPPLRNASLPLPICLIPLIYCYHSYMIIMKTHTLIHPGTFSKSYSK